MKANPLIHTFVVAGPLAMKAARLDAARESALGRQILTLPLLAARLAGGFTMPAGQDVLYPAIRAALEAGGFEDIQEVARLTGMPRAVMASLRTQWAAGTRLEAASHPRLRDFVRLERRVRDALPPGVLAPPDLVKGALERVALAPRLIGSVTIDGIIEIDPVWRPLIDAVCEVVAVRWVAPRKTAREWFKGESESFQPGAAALQCADICADPRHEARESLRWARALIARKIASPHQIAFVAASPSAWDDAFLILSREAGLPVHFSHGVPALASREGQTCAALADALLRGLTQDRVRLLLSRLPQMPFRDEVPSDWGKGIRRGAALTTPDLWLNALQRARSERSTGELAEQVLQPVIAELAKGIDAAETLGRLLLSGGSLDLWQQALRMAPAAAVELSLRALRVDDGRQPANSIVWGPAQHVANACRPYLRLIGLSANAWPRRSREDPLLPDAVQGAYQISSSDVTDRDNRIFAILTDQAEAYALSRNHRNDKGSLQAPSALWRKEGQRLLGRSRIPEHAFSESDRLYARPMDAKDDPQVAASRACWRHWNDGDRHTPHDGRIRADHPLLLDAMAQVQSTTSLQRLLCDPLGFLWQYALHWREPNLEVEPLELHPRAMGELVHALICGTLRAEALGNSEEIESSVAREAKQVEETWPIMRAVPPALLWLQTIGIAERLAVRALKEGGGFAGGQTWAEVAFGEESGDTHPWVSLEPVPIKGTELIFRGRIDRLDHDVASERVAITDYKVAKVPKRRRAAVVLDKGRELQRAFYALACNALIPDLKSVTASLAYLKDDPPSLLTLSGDDLGKAIDLVAAYAAAGVKIQRDGQIAPGHEPEYPDFLAIGLPADREAYRKAKQRVFATANAALEKLWSSP